MKRPAPSSTVLGEASVWIARRDAGLTAMEEAEFQRWIETGPENRRAMAQAMGAWRWLDLPRLRGTDLMTEQALDRRRRHRRRRFTVAAGALVLMASVTAGWWWRSSPPGVITPSVAVHTPVAPTVSGLRVQTLPDGSVVDLNQGADIEVEFSDSLRRVRLLRGEAHFTVAKNPRRPFVVQAKGIEVCAVGTAFAIRLAATEVEVLVTEGRVAVGYTHGDANASDLPAGNGSIPIVSAGGCVRLPLDGAASAPEIRQLDDVEVGERLAWRAIRLDFSGTRLAEAAAQVNRHNREQLIIDDPSLADLRVSGLVIARPLGDFVKLLEMSGVQSERLPNGDYRLRRTP